ncbi:uncharacterized protein LOC119687938 [Teleopsis dalmanni]|uniref:uncharacterized protein LOC119687938 n=1 Tax=Teleopsis dalmanni TaxID=139649 RepID=UPI0018CDACB6|nr:uncharacterized protein LOC119687938 [Teleopsis dalmanni]
MSSHISKLSGNDAEEEDYLEDMFIHVFQTTNSSQRSLQKTVLFIIEHYDYSLLLARCWGREVLNTERNLHTIVLFQILDGVHQKCVEESKANIIWHFQMMLDYVFEKLVTGCTDLKLLKYIEKMLDVWKARSVYKPKQLEHYKKLIGEVIKSLEATSPKYMQK